MAVGIRTRDNSGNIVLDAEFYTGKILGITTMSDGVNSSVTNALFSQGTPFWVAMPIAHYSTRSPTMSFAGTTLSWTWETNSGGTDFNLVYGVY